jgi:hypothetical protein
VYDEAPVVASDGAPVVRVPEPTGVQCRSVEPSRDERNGAARGCNARRRRHRRCSQAFTVALRRVEFVATSASIEWSPRQAGFSFQSDPANTSQTVHALVGNERNGVFFS